jgi:hypothetical protein
MSLDKREREVLAMGKLRRRSFLQTLASAPGGSAIGSAGAAGLDGSDRRMFLQGAAGAATGAALILAAPRVASIALDASNHSSPTESRPVVTRPSGPAPREPVTAYVRNAEKGEVTVLAGTRETTYRDPLLVKRLLDAAH